MINPRTDTTERRHKPAVKDAAPPRQPMDILLFWVTWLLLGIGIVTVYDASFTFSIEHHKGDSFYLVKRQALWTVIGLAALLIMRRVPYWKWRGAGIIGIALSMIGLVAVYLPHVGIESGGGRRWIGAGAWQFQPSEFTKLALVIYLARVTSARPKAMSGFQFGLLPPLLIIGMLGALIAHEPDLGTAIVLVSTGLTMLFLAGARLKHMAAVIGAAVLVGAAYVVVSPFRLRRVTAFFDPELHKQGAAYQVWHALIAFGTGGWKGIGFGEGREKLFMPMATTDFIFPVFAEEWGLIGTLALVVVFTMLAARGYAIAYRTKDAFGALLAAGVTTLISVQALLNIAVATSSVPNTGVPLPFISYGGSSLVLLMAGIGLLLNISSYPDGPNGRTKSDGGEADWNRRHGSASATLRIAPPPRRRPS